MKRREGCNIIDSTVKQLTDAGYTEVKFKAKERPKAKDLLCLASKAKDLWAELKDPVSSEINTEVAIIYRKK